MLKENVLEDIKLTTTTAACGNRSMVSNSAEKKILSFIGNFLGHKYLGL